jgi:hypothetical protein
MVVKANGACAPKTAPNPKKGINTIFNHFRDKPAHDKASPHRTLPDRSLVLRITSGRVLVSCQFYLLSHSSSAHAQQILYRTTDYILSG